jgi:hypothetical protein
LRIDRLSSFEHRRRWRVMTPWILGVAAAAIIFVISFPQWHKGPSGPEGTPENATQQAVEIPSAPPVESLLPRTSPAPNAPNVAPPTVSTPQPEVTSTQPPAKTIMPPSKRDASSASDAAATAPHSAVNHAPPEVSKPQPKVASTEPPAKTFAPPPPKTLTPPAKPDAASSNDAGKTAPHAVANRAPAGAPAGRGENAPAQLSLKPPRSPDTHPPETAPPESPQNEETITINGVTYVQGRQPHALGMMSEPQASTSQSTSEPSPNRNSDSDGVGGVLIQPLQ